MFCVKCGAENPDDGEFCYKCGKSLFAPKKPEVGLEAVKAHANISSHSQVTAGSAHIWAFVYGWFLILGGSALILVALISLLTGQNRTPPAVPFGSASPIGIVPSIFQGLLFSATGIAIVRKAKSAVTLVWVTTVLAGIGILFRGLIPGDLLLWVAQLGIAIWYTKKASPLARNTSARA